MHDFLASRRARITPAQAGMPTYGENRRVPGLRREEVASLAGVSFDYYARLERGNLSGVSDSVLEALAGALQLDEAERQHLFDLAKASVPASRSRPAKPPVTRVRPAVLSILNGNSWNWFTALTGRLREFYSSPKAARHLWNCTGRYGRG